MNPPAPFSFTRLVKRHRTATVFAAISLVLAVVDVLTYKQVYLLGQIHALRQHEGEEISKQLIRGPTLREESEVVATATRRIEENLVVETNLAENLWYFYKIEEDTRARLSELRQLSAPLADTGSPYRTIPYSLKLTGTYQQVSAFLYRLETGPRLARITSFSFSRASADSPVVSLDLGLNLLGRP
jgi:Tfp pilus assembly protein PilO